jgi:hypothetical protein
MINYYPRRDSSFRRNHKPPRISRLSATYSLKLLRCLRGRTRISMHTIEILANTYKLWYNVIGMAGPGPEEEMGSERRVLVVEDDVTAHEGWRAMLGSWGYDVVLAEDGETALTARGESR